MSPFSTFARLGIDHILTPDALDHLLFLATLVLGYGRGEWKRLLLLVTAFTVGHSITLALATLEVVQLPATLVELAIPVTIVLTSAMNIWGVRADGRPAPLRGARRADVAWGRYLVALGFGLVHGLGFSNVLRSLLGAEESLLVPLLAFNVGLEIAQLGVVALFAVVTWFVGEPWLGRRGWVLVASGGTLALAARMVAERA